LDSSSSAELSADLFIIGGGINGVGIARDAAGRGLKVVLAEQADLASGTSSASTKLIHGGLRYLEHFEFRLVRESLMERERLLALAPHIIFPMQFVLPHVPGLRPRWQIRLGLLLYDHIGGRKKLPASRNASLTRPPFQSGLQPHLTHGFVYSDCWVDDARLVVLNAIDAAERGAIIKTRCKFVSARRQPGGWRIECKHAEHNAPLFFFARAIVNAAGPWIEQVLQEVPDVNIEAKIRLVKGSHIVIPKLFEGQHAFLLQNPDGRVVFAIPYEQQFTLIGTTDVIYEGAPEQARITDAEVLYLCDVVNRYFKSGITGQDVAWTYAGVRPLLDDEHENASKVTRDYRLELSTAERQAPLLSVFGGKITTYRGLATSAMQKLVPLVGGSHAEWTGSAVLPGGDIPGGDFEAFLQDVQARWRFLSAPTAYRLARAYGTRIDSVLQNAREPRQLGEHFGAGLTEAEVSYLRTREWAYDAQDILWRRTKLGLHLTSAEAARLAEYLAR
jgi:glycerol-3-phosphate dehydrogenase